MTFLVVAITGAVGACTRYAFDLVAARIAPDFPLGTLLVNVSGAFALGLVAGATFGTTASAALAVGFLGAYTTFSTYALETNELAGRARTSAAAAYAVGTVIAAAAAAWLGLLVTS